MMRKPATPFGFLVCLLLACSTVEAQTPGAIASEEGIRRVNGVELYCKVMGTGEPIVIVHGGPGLDHSYFLPQLATLARTHKLIFFDQRAHGHSSAPADTNAMRLDNFVDDVEGIRKAFNLDRINLLGHSWGGLPAMSYAIKYPERLRSLILLNSVGASSDFREVAARNQMLRTTREDSLARATLMQSADFRKRSPKALAEFFRITFRSTFYNPVLADSLTLAFPDDYVAKSAMLKHMSKDRAFMAYDLHQRLAAVTCPTLIVHGESDTLPLAAAQKIQQHIRNARLVVLKNCGHFPYIEAPREFFGEVGAFLDKPQ